MLELKAAPGRTLIGYARKRVSEAYLAQLNQLLLKALGESGRYGVDATGFKNSPRQGAWSKAEPGERRGYTKLHALM